MSPALGHVLAELGLATRDLSAVSPVQSLHRNPLHWGCWFMHEPLESALAADTHLPPLSSPPPCHEVPQREAAA